MLIHEEHILHVLRGSTDAQHLAGAHGSLSVLATLLFCVCIDTKFYYGRFLISDNTNLRNGVCNLLLLELIFVCSFIYSCLHRWNERDPSFLLNTLTGTSEENQVPERWSGLLKVFYQIKDHGGFLAGSFVLSISSASYLCTWYFHF